MVSLTELRLRAVRARMGEVASGFAPPAVLGSVTLQPHQQAAVARVARMIARHGGCLLADDVGRGKTFVALATASRWHRPLVVVPASLRTTWRRAMHLAGVDCAMITHEALSRGSLPSCEPDGVIVDESHRFRSPESRRHACLATIAARAPVLLLSATPFQNRARDLAAQLALFLGSSAFRWDEAALARFVVRRADDGDGAGLPRVAPPVWLRTGHEDGAVLRAILALPPPARALDAGDAGALRTVGLVRAWASSRAALVAGLRRRMQAVTALEQCAGSGLVPTRRDLRAWHGTDGDVQLALAPLLVSHVIGAGGADLLQTVQEERAALDRVREAVRESPDPDPARIAAIRRLRVEHPDARILAFSEFATTVRAFFGLLASDHGVGMLTANEARIASGRLSRDELLDRFAPVGQGAREPVPRERVTLLLATDLLSEGVNLQDASIVVHLDLPWNPARLAQRLGRVRRPGGATMVQSCLMSPPATTELLLRVEARLRAKLARAERTIGRTLAVMPTLTPSSDPSVGRSAPPGGDSIQASAEALGSTADRVSSWQRRRASPRARLGSRLPTAAVRCEQGGWLAALSDGRLLARVGSPAAGTAGAVVRAVELACGAARSCRDAERAVALAEAARWLERERVALDCGVRGGASAIDAALDRRAATVLSRAPRHARAGLLHLATRLREGLGRTRPLGAERELHTLLGMHADRRLTDSEWFARSIGVIDHEPARARESELVRVVALIVLGPASGA